MCSKKYVIGYNYIPYLRIFAFEMKGKIQMKRNMLIRGITVILFILLMSTLLVYANHDRPRYEITETSGIEFETARVLAVVSDTTEADEEYEGVLRGSKELKLEILTGRYKGMISFVTNYYSALYNVDVKEGDTVSIRIDTTGEMQFRVSVYNYDRVPLIIGLVIFFFSVLTLVGGKQGIKAFAGLVYTVICICFLLLPLILKGFSPIPLTCAIVVVTSVVCFILIGGVQKKIVAAALGCTCGVLAAALIAQVAASIGGVTTFQMDEAEALLLVKAESELNISGLFISGILIASVGAVMDIAMSIASALDEVHILNPERTCKELFVSGMNIGRDAMGTMANTLVLAYVGSSLNMMVLIYSYGVSFIQLVNTDFVAIEMIQAIAGSAGIILTVPCVSIISAILLTDKYRVFLKGIILK